MTQDIRWKQRFSNYEKAIQQLQNALEISRPSNLEKEGTVQRFEFTHELARNVMKDFLKASGLRNVIGSRDTTKHAFAEGIIINGQIWMDMIQSRNESVHTYSGTILNRLFKKIKSNYFPLLLEFYVEMKTRV